LRLAEPTLWVTNAEMIRRIGVPEKIARQTIYMLDRNRRSGFPKKHPLGNTGIGRRLEHGSTLA
jgi:hypothetical protein